jgi:hypothetical protein
MREDTKDCFWKDVSLRNEECMKGSFKVIQVHCDRMTYKFPERCEYFSFTSLFRKISATPNLR